ncbi:hypothetical protein D3C85_1598030 [compost metagenome]
MPGIAAGRPAARLVSLQNHHTHTALGQMQGQGCTDQSGPDDDHIGLDVMLQRRVGRDWLRQRPATEANGHHP